VGSLDGKTALVTGGASGIGRAVTERLRREGAAVIVADVDREAGDGVAAETGATFVRTDVREPEQLEAAVAVALEQHGSLDIAHLNAGISTGENDIATLSWDAYRRAVGINVDGVVFGTKAVVPAMNQGGAIVATASLAGLIAYSMDVVYGLTKHAVVGFVRAAAEQLKEKGIRINAICPGFTDTPILGPFADEFRRADFPLLEPEDVAEAFMLAITSGSTGEVLICQPGRLSEPYRFRGVPGPRTAGAEGMAPPLMPGH
jgi:NAD(P)-dependent dehydrogenase (short-subunit alcohol dehydrogenase family)